MLQANELANMTDGDDGSGERISSMLCTLHTTGHE